MTTGTSIGLCSSVWEFNMGEFYWGPCAAQNHSQAAIWVYAEKIVSCVFQHFGMWVGDLLVGIFGSTIAVSFQVGEMGRL